MHSAVTQLHMDCCICQLQLLPQQTWSADPPTSLFHLKSVAHKSHLLRAAKCHWSKFLCSKANSLVCFVVESVWASTLGTEERGFGHFWRRRQRSKVLFEHRHFLPCFPLSEPWAKSHYKVQWCSSDTGYAGVWPSLCQCSSTTSAGTCTLKILWFFLLRPKFSLIWAES